MLFVCRDVNKASVGLTSATVLNEHLSTLYHLNVVILCQGLLRINIEKRSHTTKDALNVLSICLELADADAVIDLLKLAPRVFRSGLGTLFHELLKCQSIFWVNARIVIQCVQED